MSFDKYSNYNENTSFSSVVFGASKPVLEVATVRGVKMVLQQKQNQSF